MTDDDLVRNFRMGKFFGQEFEDAVIAREAELPTCTLARLAELLDVFAAIDCYYGPQAASLTLAATEAAKRLRGIPTT